MSRPEPSPEFPLRRRRVIPVRLRWPALMMLASISTLVRAEPPSSRDPSVAFSQLRTFSVVLGTSWDNPDCERRTLDAVRARVAQRGWSTASDDAADLLVVVHGSHAERIRVHRHPSRPVSKRAHRHRSDRTHHYTYRERTLIVELRERATGRVAWRAEARGAVATDFEREHARIEKKLTRLLATLPTREQPE